MNDTGVGLTLGIDASNLLRGGGLTHLQEILRAADPGRYRIDRVLVWSGNEVLDTLASRPWLQKVNPAALNRRFFSRFLWQLLSLPRAARAAGCDLLWVPGGTHSGTFHPVVTMSRNMQPFEWRELRRHRWSLYALRLLMLRFTQSRSFRQADGIIFLTEYAKREVLKVTGPLSGKSVVIPHGRSDRFDRKPRKQRSVDSYTQTDPFRLLYVSIVNQYKHQWHVVEAVGRLREATGWHLTLDLVGPSHSPALVNLELALARYDPDGQWAKYHGPVSYSRLHDYYMAADMGIFASSCENMPNILLETMSAGLPIACSNRGPMPDILGDDGVYFDPEYPDDILRALQQLISSPELRSFKAVGSYQRSLNYDWRRCANETFEFLSGFV